MNLHTANPLAAQVGRDTRLAAVQRVMLQGPIQATGRDFDFALEGDGFFQVQLFHGKIAYTRDGSFSISDQGAIVTRGGYTVLPGVHLPPDAVALTVLPDGIVSVRVAGEEDPVEIGRIQLARFTNPAGLEAMGQNLFLGTPASGRPYLGFAQEVGFGRIVQGSLEASSVEIVQDLVQMIAALRASEINRRAVEAS